MHFYLEILSAASYRSVISILRYCQKDRLVLTFLDFETRSSATVQLSVSNLGFSRMFSTHGELFFWRNIIFVPGIRILIIINLWKILIILIYIELYYMWWKSTLKDINEAAFPGSSLPHLTFRGRPTNFKFRSTRFNENCPGTLRTTSRLSRWIIHRNPTTSWCHVQDTVRTEITSFEKIT